MKIIKNSEELAKLVDENKDLHLENEDIRIKFEPSSNIENLPTLVVESVKDKKKIKNSIWGVFKGLKIEEKDIEGAKKSLFPDREF